MRNVEKLIQRHIGIYAKRYYNKKSEDLTENELRDMRPAAEWAAYVESTIPDGFENYTILDFNGCAINKKDNGTTSNIPPNIAKRARNMICKYCWGSTWREISEQKKKGEKEVKEYLRTHSIMDKRYWDRNNIAIYGESNRPIGRTMLASIVMKEALKLRFTKHAIGQSYDWIDFSKLFREIERSTMSGDGDSDDLVYLKTCEWLVVDNIHKKLRSEKQTTLYSDLLDSFFIERYNNDQPTILVFKFDIRDKLFNFERTYGTGLSRILQSDRTFKIPLSENLLNSDYE